MHKDLRTLFTPRKVKGRFSRVYCGRGSKRRCRRAMRRSLRAALTVSRADLYGRKECKDEPTAECFEKNRSTRRLRHRHPRPAVPERPTFQQTVEVTEKVPR